jgi:hypothetical protein
MDLHLTTLPAEIRDLIYEYALTETDGVCCREDENGVVWLCLCEPEAEDKAECIQITEKERASQANETDASRAVLASTEDGCWVDMKTIQRPRWSSNHVQAST